MAANYLTTPMMLAGLLMTFGTTGMVQAVVVVVESRRPALDVLAITLARSGFWVRGEREGKPNGLQDRQQGCQRWIAVCRKKFIQSLAIRLSKEHTTLPSLKAVERGDCRCFLWLWQGSVLWVATVTFPNH